MVVGRCWGCCPSVKFAAMKPIPSREEIHGRISRADLVRISIEIPETAIITNPDRATVNKMGTDSG